MKKIAYFCLKFIFLGSVLWLAGLLYFIMQIPTFPTSNKEQTDAIIVLTGGQQRIETGFNLLKQGMAKKLFISGVFQKLSPKDLAPLTEVDLESLLQDIELGYRAGDTIGNAEEIALWLDKRGYHSIRLVTANYHMPRTLKECRETLPREIKIIPHPVFPEDFKLKHWWYETPTRHLIISEYHKMILSQLRHLIFTLLQRKI